MVSDGLVGRKESIVEKVPVLRDAVTRVFSGGIGDVSKESFGLSIRDMSPKVLEKVGPVERKTFVKFVDAAYTQKKIPLNLEIYARSLQKISALMLRKVIKD